MSKKKTVGDHYSVSLGCMLLPKKMSGTMAMKVDQLQEITGNVFKRAQGLRMEFIKDNFPTVTINKKKFPVEVDKEFEMFMHPFYKLPLMKAKTDALGNPIKDDDGNIVREEETEKDIELMNKRINYLKVIKVINEDEAYKKFVIEIMSVEENKSLPKLIRSDFAGVELRDRSILKYFKSILKH